MLMKTDIREECSSKVYKRKHGRKSDGDMGLTRKKKSGVMGVLRQGHHLGKANPWSFLQLLTSTTYLNVYVVLSLIIKSLDIHFLLVFDTPTGTIAPLTKDACVSQLNG
jgi:hypothetical protein